MTPARSAGKRVVELGAGVGLAGLVAAQLGAHAVLTDRRPLTSLLRMNAALNWLAGTPDPRWEIHSLQGTETLTSAPLSVTKYGWRGPLDLQSGGARRTAGFLKSRSRPIGSHPSSRDAVISFCRHLIHSSAAQPLAPADLQGSRRRCCGAAAGPSRGGSPRLGRARQGNHNSAAAAAAAGLYTGSRLLLC